MCCSGYSHYAIRDGLDKMTPECIFGLLLACRFVVRLQIQARESRSERSASRPSNYTNGFRNGTSVRAAADAAAPADSDNKKND